jgi:hypothetical protein
MSTTPITPTQVSGVSNVDISSMSLETAIMYVQSQRAEMLEDGLRGQLQEVKARNDQIKQINGPPERASGLQAGRHGPQRQGQARRRPGQGERHHRPAEGAGRVAPAREVGREERRNTVTLQDGTKYENLSAEEKAVAEDYKAKDWAFRSDNYSGDKRITDIKEVKTGNPNPDVTLKNVEGWIEDAKSAIEGLNSQQQLDMLKMQSYTTKINQCYDTISNTMKKLSESSSNIIGNMR